MRVTLKLLLREGKTDLLVFMIASINPKVCLTGLMVKLALCEKHKPHGEKINLLFS
jgi:hypothetical protein